MTEVVNASDVDQNKWPWRFSCTNCASTEIVKAREMKGYKEPYTHFRCHNCGTSTERVYDKKQDTAVKLRTRNDD